MRITESRLRRIIRQVIAESYTDDAYEEAMAGGQHLGHNPLAPWKSNYPERDLSQQELPEKDISSCEDVENHILEHSIQDVEEMIDLYLSVYEKGMCKKSEMKASFVRMLKVFGYPEHAIKAALSDIEAKLHNKGLISEPYDDHDYGV